MAAIIIPEYKYYVTHNAVTTQVYPSFESLPSIDYQKQGDNLTLIESLKGQFVFTGNDYTYFLDIEQNGFCDLLTFDIQQRCGSKIYGSIFTCEFGVSDGEWDKDSCVFSIEPVAISTYRKMFSGLPVNIAAMTQTDSVDYFTSNGTASGVSTVLFEDMLLYVAQATNPDIVSIISDFFQINPVTVSAINYVTETTNMYTSMMCCPLSNVRYPLPTNPATNEPITWVELMNDLRVMFKVDWYVDSSDNIVIEHFSRFNSTTGLDLTVPAYAQYVSGTNKYNYLSTESPRYEEWTMSGSEQGCLIEYDNSCGSMKLNEDKKTYQVKKLYTDLYRAINDSANLAGGTRGIFLFATENLAGTDYVLGSYLTGNDELLLPRLVLKFHRYGRPQLTGTFTFYDQLGDETTLAYGDLWNYSEAARKQQTEITIPWCCTDEFDSALTVTTFMGEGVVQNASHNLYDNTLKLKLLYKVNADNTDITDPTDIADCELWCSGDQGKTISGGKVVQWNDLTGNGNHFVQPTGADAPTDGTTYINFTGDMMYTTTAWQTFPAKRGSIFIVCLNSDATTPPASAASDATLLAIDGANKWDISLDYVYQATPALDSWLLHSYDLAVNYPATGYMMAYTNPYGWYNDKPLLIELIRDGDTTQSIWLNGKPPINNTMTIPNNLPSVDNVILGGIDATNKRYSGRIYEVIIYNRDLTDSERQQVEQYLSKKYAMNLYHVS